jgi:hypothetical protein
MIGMRKKRPGPLGCGSRRPSLKMTPRSYSRATLTAAMTTIATKTTTTARMIRPVMARSFREM